MAAAQNPLNARFEAILTNRRANHIIYAVSVIMDSILLINNKKSGEK